MVDPAHEPPKRRQNDLGYQVDLDRVWDRDRYLSLADTARMIGLSVPALQSRVRRCQSPLAAYRRGRRWFFRATDVTAYVASHGGRVPRAKRRVLAGTSRDARPARSLPAPPAPAPQPFGATVPTLRDRLRAARAKDGDR